MGAPPTAEEMRQQTIDHILWVMDNSLPSDSVEPWLPDAGAIFDEFVAPLQADIAELLRQRDEVTRMLRRLVDEIDVMEITEMYAYLEAAAYLSMLDVVWNAKTDRDTP